MPWSGAREFTRIELQWRRLRPFAETDDRRAGVYRIADTRSSSHAAATQPIA
jgi:hypothetical protein